MSCQNHTDNGVYGCCHRLRLFCRDRVLSLWPLWGWQSVLCLTSIIHLVLSRSLWLSNHVWTSSICGQKCKYLWDTKTMKWNTGYVYVCANENLGRQIPLSFSTLSATKQMCLVIWRLLLNLRLHFLHSSDVFRLRSFSFISTITSVTVCCFSLDLLLPLLAESVLLLMDPFGLPLFLLIGPSKKCPFLFLN